MGISSSPFCSEEELEKELKDVRKKLLLPLPSTPELLTLLDNVESAFSKVEQGPSIAIQDAIKPSIEALAANELLRHPDIDVKVSVASCISEILRITAPDQPYTDEQMKEFFQLSVMAFEKLSSISGRCYSKALLVLETFAKLRLFTLMLDQALDALVEMFRQFLNTIQSNHDQAVLLNMENIMTSVIKESQHEELPFELISILLASVEKENREKKELAADADCLVEVSPADGVPNLVMNNDSNMMSDGPLEAVNSLRKLDPFQIMSDGILEDANILKTFGHSQMTNAATLEDVNSLKSLEPSQMMNDRTLKDVNFLKTLKPSHQFKLQKIGAAGTNLQPKYMETPETGKQELDPETIPRKRGRRPNSLLKPEEGYDPSWVSGGSKSCVIPHRGKNPTNPHNHSASKESRLPSNLEKETNLQVFAARMSNNGRTSASPSKRFSFHDKTYSRRRRQKKKESMTNHGGGVDLWAVPVGEFLRAHVEEQTAAVAVATLRKDSDGGGHSKAKYRRDHGKNGDPSNTVAACSNVEGRQTSSASQMDAKKRSRGKTTSAKPVAKESVSKASKTTSVFNNHHQKLVGCKIKVWWPKDKMFYNGVVLSFDPAQRKHQVLYEDGDEELLDLREEQWELLGDEQGTIPGANDSADKFSNDATGSSGPAKKKHKVSNDAADEPKLTTCRERRKPVRSKSKQPGRPAVISSSASCNRVNRQSRKDKTGNKLAMATSIRANRPFSSQLAIACSEKVEVNGYKVNASSAAVLTAIFEKHGDIAANCLHKSPSVKAFFLEVVCDFVQRLQCEGNAIDIPTLQEIENGVSDAEAANLEVSWLREDLRAIHELANAGQRSSLLKEVNAKTLLASKAAMRDLRQRQVELEAAQERLEKARRCVEALELVTRKINNDILESEAKENSLTSLHRLL
ncbi:hypothetical protein RJ639_034620 [Escallonia herrerae]|uniref:PTM/DIR17-like Tudor domain-containing protein n=1 Tax=Escallonia herrerae TaxID=1293975 RepID=A0AA89BA64_9ASTE|nr:hypothetical protein RJ639_034620 [Escallonia herrerae]